MATSKEKAVNVGTTAGKLVAFTSLSADAEAIGGETYIGDLPPAYAALPGIVRRLYLAETKGNDPVIKVLYVCTDGKYTDFVAWDNVTLNNKAAFKWRPLCKALGVTPDDLIRRTRVDPTEDAELGLRIVAIGDLDMSGNNAVPVYFGVRYGTYNDAKQTYVAGVKPRAMSTAGLSTFLIDDTDERKGDSANSPEDKWLTE